ncbi:hypothetical protein BHE74_00052633 [Ensete ventricosum]|uniref:Uncharacterized protein n=1 Tax=Ensete ventricosum TaxID=4639 RepID=A0A444BYJ2_ENSVE|nr:hypothetical protein GW17_00060298 [Ensete ventricosum]RWW41851.1 hypothetical protein BHE74_00052633 [Ensete ventricosum]RZR73133.1 hypothetical protein BHM03_00020671 [Ensete ventricosum]
MSSYHSTTPAVLTVRRASTGKGCRSYLCQVGCTTTNTLILASDRLPTSTGPLSKGVRTWRPGADPTEQELGNLNGVRADPIKQELGNLNGAGAYPTEQELGNLNGAGADSTEQKLGNLNGAGADLTEQELRK